MSFSQAALDARLSNLGHLVRRVPNKYPLTTSKPQLEPQKITLFVKSKMPTRLPEKNGDDNRIPVMQLLKVEKYGYDTLRKSVNNFLVVRERS